jgi:phospholipid/cholesterol/gamma-HCH transport system ATP-binding protein
MVAKIEVRDIVNRFGDQTVHDDLNMTLEKGEILGLVGGSGSGKSVLLRTILGLHKPQAGEVVIDGVDMIGLSLDEKLILQRKWGVLFQNGALFSGLTVLDNIALPLREHTDLADADIKDLARLKIGMVGLKPDAADKFPSELSGGMVKRASLARALALDPEILFFDEPTAGLDPIAADAFDRLTLSLRDALDLSVLIITHDVDTLVTICDRVAMLVDRKVTVGTIDDMMQSDHPWIRDYFNGPRMRAAMHIENKAQQNPQPDGAR